MFSIRPQKSTLALNVTSTFVLFCFLSQNVLLVSVDFEKSSTYLSIKHVNWRDDDRQNGIRLKDMEHNDKNTTYIIRVTQHMTRNAECCHAECYLC